MNALDVQDLSISFGGVKAIQDLSFDVHEGHVHAIIGPNGAGKTTLINLITGIYTPEAGRIALFGQPAAGVAPDQLARLGLSRTFQNLQVCMNMSAVDNVMIGAHLSLASGLLAGMFRLPSMRRADAACRERALALMEFVGVGAFARAEASQLPYGALKRLEIARALAARPKLLLMDEPAAGLNHTETAEIEKLMMTSTAFVLFMTVPGLALFYAGMVRSKNALSTVMQSFAIFCVIAVLWVIYGYSLAFTAGNAFIGSFDKVFMRGEDLGTAVAATFSKGQYLPDTVYCMFQLTFAAITVVLICGGFAERFRFRAMIIFSILWFTFAYLPIAHMVWYWDGPDAYTTQAAADVANSHAGKIFQLGALDFAGGTVVHVNSGIAALVCALVLGRRAGFGRVSMAPHSLMMTAIGTGMLWMGWFGFNAGSALEATGAAGVAFFNTLFGPATAGVAWSLAEWMVKGKPSVLGVCSGIVAGLVAITPAAGYVGPVGAFVICAVVGVVCFFAVTKLKSWLKYDDALDTFGVHGLGGIMGSIGTGIFVNPAFGGTGVYDYVAGKVADFDAKAQLVSQLWDVGITLVWSGFVAFVIMILLKATLGVRSSDEDQEEGLDLADHGEKAYNF